MGRVRHSGPGGPVHQFAHRPAEHLLAQCRSPALFDLGYTYPRAESSSSQRRSISHIPSRVILLAVDGSGGLCYNIHLLTKERTYV
jgi:hypothetical protein